MNTESQKFFIFHMRILNSLSCYLPAGAAEKPQMESRTHDILYEIVAVPSLAQFCGVFRGMNDGSSGGGSCSQICHGGIHFLNKISLTNHYEHNLGS